MLLSSIVDEQLFTTHSYQIWFINMNMVWLIWYDMIDMIWNDMKLNEMIYDMIYLYIIPALVSLAEEVGMNQMTFWCCFQPQSFFDWVIWWRDKIWYDITLVEPTWIANAELTLVKQSWTHTVTACTMFLDILCSTCTVKDLHYWRGTHCYHHCCRKMVTDYE